MAGRLAIARRVGEATRCTSKVEMMEPVDAAFLEFQRLIKAFENDNSVVENEADLRFRFLDEVFTEVLGWTKDDIRVEPASESGYADYLFSTRGRNAAVVEAKRTGIELVSTAKEGRSAYLLRGSVLKPAMSGIRQAKEYASDHSCALAAVTTGLSWVLFLTNRQDGLPFLDGQAIVYPTLKSISDDFSMFYDIMSKEGVSEKRYLVRFSRLEGTLVTPSIEWYVAVDERRNQLLGRDKLAQDLDRVFDRFFKSLLDDSDAQMLIDCFVDTKESRFADTTMQKLAEEVLADISSLTSGAGEELQEEIAGAIESKLGEIVLIVGSKGAGKSTFIDRFFTIVLSRSLRDRCAVLRADLAEATQDEGRVESWLTERLIDQLEKRLFKDATPGFDELQGMYFAEYNGWKVGELRFLYEKDRDEFKIKFGMWMRDQRTADRYGYLVRLLKTANTQRLLMPCVIFDNADQFPQSFQERVFQYGYALFRAAISFIIVPITDRTIWQLSKAGPLQSYATKSFYLPVPPTKDILERRVAYLRKRSEASKEDAGSYFLSRGIRLSISNIAAFAATVEEVFVKRDFVSRRVSWLSNLDLRRSLELTQRMITSPALQIEQLVTAYVAGHDPKLGDGRITRALVVGNHRFFDEASNGFVQNMFVVAHDRLVSPLLRLSILRLLLDRLGASRDDQTMEYMDLSAMMSYFEPCGIRAVDLVETISAMMKSRLVDPYDPASESSDSGARIRISYAGRIHYEMALTDAQYICQMALRTPIRSAVIVDRIRPLTVFPREPGPWHNAAAAFAEYLLKEDASLIAMPRDHAYDGQRTMRLDFAKWLRAVQMSYS
jgi:energy-coupling factor transporter ATP-binding protein EcfA2